MRVAAALPDDNAVLLVLDAAEDRVHAMHATFCDYFVRFPALSWDGETAVFASADLQSPDRRIAAVLTPDSAVDTSTGIESFNDILGISRPAIAWTGSIFLDGPEEAPGSRLILIAPDL